MLTERREFELSEEGFIGLTFRKDSDNACFFSANSVQKPKYFGNSDGGQRAETNYRLGTQLPYMFIMHAPRALPEGAAARADRHAGRSAPISSASSTTGSASTSPTWTTRRRRCASAARCARRRSWSRTSRATPAGTRCDMQVRPHFKYMGAFFTLILVGKLDKE